MKMNWVKLNLSDENPLLSTAFLPYLYICVEMSHKAKRTEMNNHNFLVTADNR